MRISPTLYILYLFVFLLVACNRRELTYSPEATITISADWSQSGLNEKEQDYGATAIFYPTDGSTPFVALMGDRYIQDPMLERRMLQCRPFQPFIR